MTKKQVLLAATFLLSFFSVAASSVQGQVAPSAFRSPISLTVGGMGSIFRPDYVDYGIGGVGAFVDLNIYHGVGLEAEGRWQRFHEYYGINQDNYLIGPRVKLHPLWRAQPYAKALAGYSKMNFGKTGAYENWVGSGRFTTVAFGGGLDFKMTKRISVRAVDVEYQWWPDFLGSHISPYGASAGVSYRIF